MPFFDFKCSNCNHEVLRARLNEDAPVPHCPKCEQNTLIKKPSENVELMWFCKGEPPNKK